MQPFLSYVAQDILQKYGDDLSALTVVFPNKRASLFLNQWLVSLTPRPMWSPTYVTISDLFRQYSSLTVADPITAVVELHKSFVSITGRDETLDQFFGWGQLLLADFDDIDKNLADADKVFANVRDWHEYDDVSYLTPSQKALLQRFFRNFEGTDTLLKRRFRELWSKLRDVYVDYRQRLRSQGLAYEGMLYRDALQNNDIEFSSDKYLFVGFNMLHKVEQRLFRLLQRQGKAAFYWDYDDHYIATGEAGVYIRQYLSLFPNELSADRSDIFHNLNAAPKQITFVSALTEDIQARYITEWLRQDNRIEAGNRTAIVMCDENILHTAIHCLPPEVSSMNVTTGYPLRLTPIASLVSQLLALQGEGYAPRRQAFRLYYLNRVLRHPYASFISKDAAEHASRLNSAKQYYVSASDLPESDEGMQLLLQHVAATNESLLAWLLRLNRRIATSPASPDEPLFQESLFRMYTLLNRLHDLVLTGQLQISRATMQRFISQAIAGTTIPFHGEPAEGIQLMGVLETRNLDFDHLLLLSCNEGNMPKGVNDSSFIPHAIRRAYDLTTVDNKVAIYSYYFHRLLQRCGDITIMYNKSTEGVSTGEMSQFMLQLLVELRHPVRRLTLHAGQLPMHHQPSSIVKNQQVVKALEQYTQLALSPTAINTYLRCQLRFYYKYVAHIREQDQSDEDIIDNRIFGNIFHRAAELMYTTLLPQDSITVADIDYVLKHPAMIERVVTQAVGEKLFNRPEGDTSPLPPLNGMQLINKEVVETYLRHLLNLDRKFVPFRVLFHEHPVSTQINLEGQSVQIQGVIDRLDIVTDCQGAEHLRVVDYKTGSRPQGSVKTIDDVFRPEKIDTAHSDYILQAMLYSVIVADDATLSGGRPVSPALLYIQQSHGEDYDPTVQINRQPVTDARALYGDDFMQQLRQTLQDIFNPALSFVPTEQRARCETCPYYALCMR